jgi:fatty-acyl-CoA synthase
VNINPAYVGRELEYCINKVGCKGLLLSPSVKVIDSLSIFRRLVPELDEHSLTHELISKRLPTLKHVILTGDSSNVRGAHSYRDLVQSGRQRSYTKLNERQASVNPDAPLSIFYTSGTTGQPKAATLTNFGLLNLVYAQWEHLGPYFTRLCVPIPMFHIFSEVVGVLNTAVAKCQIIFPSILPDVLSTMATIDEEKCTALIGAPIIFRDILNHPDRKKYDLSSLIYGAVGASPMHIDFLKQLEKEIPITRVAQGYGMTENGALLTSAMWAGDDDHRRRLGSLGRCMQGLEIKVADRNGNAVPIGQQGEIWARGYPIMSGYYGDPEKTRDTITSAGWLRTGDEAKMDDDGYLYYIGRQKEMIIRGGVNIYPIEIENAIIEHPSVAEAQVFSIPDQRYGEEVCAWIKLKVDATRCQPDDITKFLLDRLAFFKIPKHIRIVDKFIMTPTGKVQKFKLSEAMINELKGTTAS